MKKYKSERIKIPTNDSALDLLILRPTVSAKPADQTPAVLWIHGGGYIIGSANMVYISRAMALVEKYGAVIVTPDYRLAGKAPYPAALEDCYTALKYIKDNAVALSCNPDKIMVGGESAGGGLTASLCMYARDRGEVNIAFQMPLYPMLDDRKTDSSRHNFGISWGTSQNQIAWKQYLSKVHGTPPVYAVPARQTDYSNLPPAYTFVGNKEPFYCETLSYIENLQAAGVSARVDVYPTGFHAFDIVQPHRKLSRIAISEFEKQYLFAAEHYNAAQNR